MADPVHECQTLWSSLQYYTASLKKKSSDEISFDQKKKKILYIWRFLLNLKLLDAFICNGKWDQISDCWAAENAHPKKKKSLL